MPLIPTRTYNKITSFDVPYSQEDVLQFLNDIPAFLKINNAIVKVEQDKKDPATWHVTEQLGAIFLYTKTTCAARVEALPNGGVRYAVTAGMGIVGTSNWSVESLPPSESGVAQCKITEDATIAVSALLAPMVKAQWVAVHDKIPPSIREGLDKRFASST